MKTRKRNVRATVFRGEMGTGKSTAAELYNDEVMQFPKKNFFEGDKVLQLPELADLKKKVDVNEALNEADVKRITETYIREVVKRAKEQPTITAQALYFNDDCKALEDAFAKEFGSKDSVAFVWVSTPTPKHYLQLFKREFSKYLNEHRLADDQNESLVEGFKRSISNLTNAFLSACRSIKTNIEYSEYFEKPAGHFKEYSSWKNYKKGIKTTDAVSAIKIDNTGDTTALVARLRSLPFDVCIPAQSSTAPILSLIQDAKPVPALSVAPSRTLAASLPKLDKSPITTRPRFDDVSVFDEAPQYKHAYIP